MQERRTPNYIPLATERTKEAFKHLAPGLRRKIDLVNAKDRNDQLESDAWALEDTDGVHFSYQDGPLGGNVYLGFADQVRVIFEELPTEEKSPPE